MAPTFAGIFSVGSTATSGCCVTDPTGERIFAVLTKLDLMDKGTNALDVNNRTPLVSFICEHVMASPPASLRRVHRLPYGVLQGGESLNILLRVLIMDTWQAKWVLNILQNFYQGACD